jgi:hypothetical protein
MLGDMQNSGIAFWALVETADFPMLGLESIACQSRRRLPLASKLTSKILMILAREMLSKLEVRCHRFASDRPQRTEVKDDGNILTIHAYFQRLFQSNVSVLEVISAYKESRHPNPSLSLFGKTAICWG